MAPSAQTAVQSAPRKATTGWTDRPMARAPPGHGDQWDAPESWARGSPHMSPRVNRLEEELAQPQAHERPGWARGRADANDDAAPANDLILNHQHSSLSLSLFFDTFSRLLSAPRRAITNGECFNHFTSKKNVGLSPKSCVAGTSEFPAPLRCILNAPRSQPTNRFV